MKCPRRSCLHATFAVFMSSFAHTVPHSPWRYISSLPASRLVPYPDNLRSPSSWEKTERERERGEREREREREWDKKEGIVIIMIYPAGQGLETYLVSDI